MLRHLDCDHARDYAIRTNYASSYFSFLSTHFTDAGVGESIILRQLSCVRSWEWSQIVAMLLAACWLMISGNIKSEMRSCKSDENIHKKEGGSYYEVSANKGSSVTL